MGSPHPPISLAITLGDPLGIGLEVTTKALQKILQDKTLPPVSFKIFGDHCALQELESLSDVVQTVATSEQYDLTSLTIAQAGEVSVAALDGALGAFHRGEIKGLITAPIAKAHVGAAGFAFPGHTEYLAHSTDTQKFTMMLAGPKLRVTLVTIHHPLSQVAARLSQEKIIETIALTYQSLKNDFGIDAPRVAVCGLNPHAGEQGLLGPEENEIIGPAIAKAHDLGYHAFGPQVPDAVFHEAYQGRWDAVVCMYHDQGLIPFKMIHFDQGVNVTLGLPLVRTSPDHGTAFDIAGQNKADATSMEAAIRLAIDLVARRQKNKV